MTLASISSLFHSSSGETDSVAKAILFGTNDFIALPILVKFLSVWTPRVLNYSLIAGLQLRIYAMRFYETNGTYWGDKEEKLIGYADGRLTIRSVKVFTDGE